jgi:hypothetical protein
MRPHHPTTAHFLRQPAEIGLLVTQAFQHLLRLGLHLRIVQRIVLGVGLHVFGTVDRPGRFQLFQLLFQGRHFARTPGGHFQHRLHSDRLTLLRQIADHRPRIPLDGTLVRNVSLQDDREQCGFAGPVRPDQGHTVTIIDLQRRVFKQNASGNRHLEISNG